MQNLTDSTKRQKVDPWFCLSVGMVFLSVVGLLYAYLHR